MDKPTEQIETRQDFVVFLKGLLADLQASKSNWENKDLKSFLEALSRYAEGIDGFYLNTNKKINADKASWKVIADMFMGVRMYE